MLNNFNVSTRLYSLTLFMSLLVLAIGFLGLNSAKNSNAGLDTVYKDRVVPLKDLKIIADMYAVNIVDTSHKLRNGALQWADAERNVREAQKTIAGKWKAYLATTLVPEEKKLVDETLPLMKAADAATEKLLNLIIKNDAAGVTAFTISELYPAIDPVSGKFTELVDVQLKVAKQEYDGSSALYRRTMTISIAAILAGVLFAAALGVTIARSITRPLATGVDVADALANGDFTVDPEVQGSDETARLLGAMKNMAARLREVISQTVVISDGVASASTQLHATSDQIANGSEELAQQTGTVATASEEMAATSGDIARNCLMAAEASRRTSTSAREGATVVNATIEGMKRISERVKSASTTVETLGNRSEEIGAIIGTIEDIADQTNLLALNAAIEAARAGEQGRGFAVVADEVRALAERTTKATGEISKMIKSIQNETREAVRSMEEGVREVEAGAASSQKSGEVLEAILDQINDVTEQINLIATAAEEQTATTGEITSNIAQVAEVVHHTARGAEETSSAAGQLADQAQRLQTLMSHFRTA